MKNTEMSDQERKALIALADNGTGKMTTYVWRWEHGATERIRQKLRRMNLIVWKPPCWCLTEKGKSRADEERMR